MSKPEEAPAEPKPEFDPGAALKAARLKKGLRQEELAKALRIPVRQVQALEHNRREDFPGPVYYRGALQSFCEHVDLDFHALWKQMHPPPPASTPLSTGPLSAGPKAPPPPKTAVSIPKLSPSLLAPGALFATLLLAAAVVWLVNLAQVPAPAPPPRPRPAVTEPIPVPPPPPRTHRHVIRVEPTVEAWVRIRVDRKLVFEGNLPAGRATSWEGDRSFGIRTPREAALRVWLDEQPVDLASFPRDSYGNILIQPSTGASTASTPLSTGSLSTGPAAPPSAPPLIP